MKPQVISLLLSLTILLGGCATYIPSVPKDYTGPIASITDTPVRHSGTKVDFFYIEKIDGKAIENSRIKSLSENYGKGFHMSPVELDRPVPAKETTFTIVGRTEYAAPILAMSNPVYQVVGEVTFTPEDGKSYRVRGRLTEERSSVWIEDKESKQVMGEKIEVEGSTKLGFWKK